MVDGARQPSERGFLRPLRRLRVCHLGRTWSAPYALVRRNPKPCIASRHGPARPVRPNASWNQSKRIASNGVVLLHFLNDHSKHGLLNRSQI
jgi:hypothetical protein